MSTALVTDSTAQLPDELREQYAVLVVPITVSLDGEPHREGVDVDASTFYERIAGGAEVTTSAPSPGEVLDVYRDAARGGADEILSVHVGSNVSSTLNSVRVAVEQSPIPVRIVDTGTASFAQGLCVWEAAEHLHRGASAGEAAAAAGRTARHLGDVFVVGVPELAQRGGRLDIRGGIDRLTVITFAGGLSAIGQASSVEDAIRVMVDHIASWAGDRPLRVGIGDGIAATAADRLAEALHEVPVVKELVRYTVGPSVGAHTGPGTFGAVYAPIGRPSG